MLAYIHTYIHTYLHTRIYAYTHICMHMYINVQLHKFTLLVAHPFQIGMDALAAGGGAGSNLETEGAELGRKFGASTAA